MKIIKSISLCDNKNYIWYELYMKSVLYENQKQFFGNVFEIWQTNFKNLKAYITKEQEECYLFFPEKIHFHKNGEISVSYKVINQNFERIKTNQNMITIGDDISHLKIINQNYHYEHENYNYLNFCDHGSEIKCFYYANLFNSNLQFTKRYEDDGYNMSVLWKKKFIGNVSEYSIKNNELKISKDSSGIKNTIDIRNANKKVFMEFLKEINAPLFNQSKKYLKLYEYIYNRFYEQSYLDTYDKNNLDKWCTSEKISILSKIFYFLKDDHMGFRKQALENFPCAIQAFLGEKKFFTLDTSNKNETLSTYKKLCKKIDDGCSVLESLSEVLETNNKAINYFEKIKNHYFQINSLRFFKENSKIEKILSPNTKQGNFNIEILSKISGNPVSTINKYILYKIKNSGISENIFPSYNHYHTIDDFLIWLQDYLYHSEQTYIEKGCFEKGFDDFFGILTDGKNWSEIVKIAKEWEKKVSQYEDERLSDLKWAPGIGIHKIKIDETEYEFAELSSAEKIVKEGKEMCHCVGTMVDMAYIGNYHIFSVKTKSERSTLMINRSYDSQEYQVGQHYGYKNSDINKNFDNAANSLLKKINSNELKLNQFNEERKKEIEKKNQISVSHIILDEMIKNRISASNDMKI